MGRFRIGLNDPLVTSPILVLPSTVNIGVCALAGEPSIKKPTLFLLGPFLS